MRNDSTLIYGVIYDEILWNGFLSALFLIDGREIWLSYAEIEIYEEEKRVEMPEWLLIKEGLEGYSDDYVGQ